MDFALSARMDDVPEHTGDVSGWILLYAGTRVDCVCDAAIDDIAVLDHSELFTVCNKTKNDVRLIRDTVNLQPQSGEVEIPVKRHAQVKDGINPLFDISECRGH